MTLDEIHSEVTNNEAVLFMKGTPVFPQCGFSAKVVNMLENVGIRYVAYDVLADAVLRENIKTYSDWPTIPQLYMNGEFVGGSDIVTDMYESGELKKLDF